ncbi:DMT family transporter [Mesorhizobium calcicola]|uniref:DMT family transporter n=1 Tax=Mesorhizobium calcicola TaxID=1300310 RepID=A0ABW4WL90_9HYPH
MTNGILLALLAYASYSGSDAVIKSLGGQLTVFEIGFFVTLFAGCLLFFARPANERWRDFWRMKRPWAVQARAWAGIASGVLSVYAFTHIPLAEVYALIFLAPLLVTILSTVILKEKVGPWRWLAVVAGFAGVMLVVRPGFRELNLGHLATFVNAFLAATSVTLMRSLAQQEKLTSMLGVLGLLFNGVGAATTSFALPNVVQLVWLAMAGAFTAGGQFMQLLAAKYAPANRIAPTHYSQIVWAVVLGALFFREYPDWLSLVGLAVVGGAGLLTMVREEARLGTVRWNPFSRTRL